MPSQIKKIHNRKCSQSKQRRVLENMLFLRNIFSSCLKSSNTRLAKGVIFPSTLSNHYLLVRLATDMSWAVSSPSNRTRVCLVFHETII